MKLMPAHLSKSTFLMNIANGIESTFWKKVTHMLACLFYIEMLQAMVAEVMEKYHDKHNFSLFHMIEARWYERFIIGLSVYFDTIASKNLQKSSAIQNNSVTLLSVIIAIVVCKSL